MTEKEKKDNQENNDNEEKKNSNLDEEEFLKILEELYNSNDKQVKVKTVKKIGITNKVVNNIWLDFLIMTIINMGLLIALCGWFNVINTKHFYELVIISFVFSIVDYFIKALVFKLKPEWYIKTLGLLFVLITIIVLVGVMVGAYYLFDASFNKPIIDVACILILLIVRSCITTYIKKLNLRRNLK